MFIQSTLLNSEVVNDNVRVTFHVRDTCFEQNITLEAPSHFVKEPAFEVIALINLYSQKHLNVARNLAFYYISIDGNSLEEFTSNISGYIESDYNWIIKHFPHLNYDKYIDAVTLRYIELSDGLKLMYDTNRKLLKLGLIKFVTTTHKIQEPSV